MLSLQTQQIQTGILPLQNFLKHAALMNLFIKVQHSPTGVNFYFLRGGEERWRQFCRKKIVAWQSQGMVPRECFRAMQQCCFLRSEPHIFHKFSFEEPLVARRLQSVKFARKRWGAVSILLSPLPRTEKTSALHIQRNETPNNCMQRE